jgi:hypothetical protein
MVKFYCSKGRHMQICFPYAMVRVVLTNQKFKFERTVRPRKVDKDG